MATNLTDIHTKLVDISTQYSKFNKNQVLTETQLNTFLDYFDDQDRLTRTSLSGVGIVCGFNITYNADDKIIQITQGRGVTTDGDLIALQKKSDTEAGQKDTTLKSIDLSSKTYTHFKLFSDNKAQYQHFVKPDNTPIDLWELQEQEADNNTHLSKFSEEFPPLSNMVVLLYVESYSKEGDLCTQLTCDNQGIEQVSRLRVLLVSHQNAQYIIDNDPIFKGNDWYETYLALKEVSAKRVVLNNTNSKKNSELKKSYLQAIKDNDTLERLGESLDLIFRKFGQSPVSHLLDQLLDFNEAKIPTDFQYRYDLLKDFIDTYNEIKEVLLDLNVECCPNIGSFPKHLMIGRLVEMQEYKTFRHSFYKSPIIASENEKYQKVLSLLEKIKELTEQYKLTNKGEEIKITPSLTQATLSEKSIPFYYNVTNSLLEKWSVKTSKYLRKRYNLSYHTDNLADVPSVRNPLDYNLDSFDFYRIEGHQGKLYRDALDQITKLKRDKGLNFDVKVLSIETDKESLDITEYKCQFKDLTVLLEAWRAEQDCVLAEVSQFLSGFSIDDPGSNTSTGRNDSDKMSEAEAMAAMSRFKTGEKMVKVGMQRSRLPEGKTNNFSSWLETDQTSVGGAMADIFSEEYTSVSDIQLSVYNVMQGIAQLDIWTQREDYLGNFVLEDIPALLVIIYLLDSRIPSSLTQITDQSLDQYREAVNLLCGKVVEMQTKYDELELSPETKQTLALLFSRLSSVCCSAKKLEVLYEEIQSRKEHILKQTQLCEFIKNHPGLEHKAGVVPGGTFVMVYLKEAEESEPVYPTVVLEIPFVEQPQINADGLSGEQVRIELWEDRFSQQFFFVGDTIEEMEVPLNQVVQIGETIEETVQNVSTFLNATWENADGAGKLEAEANGNILLISIKDRSVPEASFFVQFENPATVGSESEFFFEPNSVLESSVTNRNTVIADFSLPYMCCSDCSPINFIIPAEPILLSLPVSHICLKEGEEVVPIPFDVSPRDGEVKADIASDVPTGVTTDENGNFVFDASLMDESLYGEEIRFTVNDEETNCRITVYGDIELTVTTSVTYDEMRTVATVLYEVSNRYADLTHSWDFGNGEAYDEVPNENRIVEKVYELSLLDFNTIEPSLFVTNGLCGKEIPIDPITFEENVEVNLDIIDTYCLNISSEEDAVIPFTEKQPQGAQIALVGSDLPGLTIGENEITINPMEFQDFNTPINFTLGGQPTNAEIIIGVTFEVEMNENDGVYNWVNNELHYRYNLEALLPNNVDTGSVVYRWLIDNEEVGNDNVLEINRPVDKENGTTEISVEVSLGGPCTSLGSTNVGVPYPNFRLRMPNDKVTYCLQDRAFYPITIDPEIEGTLVEGNGVSTDANGNPQFRVIDTGLAAAGKVDLGIAGEKLLEITINEAPEASFVATIEGEELILVNNSDEADFYKWDVGGIQIERQEKQDEKISLDQIDGDFINITLEVGGECGSDTFVVQEFEIKREATTKTCAEETKERIIIDGRNIPKDVAFDDENITNKIIMPTIKLYETFEVAPVEVLDSGNIDGVNAVQSLFSGTSEAITNSVNDPDGQRILSQYFIAQIKLYFNILHCQPHDALEAEKAGIIKTIEALRNNMGRLKEFGVTFDEEGQLKQFLTAYSNDAVVIDYLKAVIQTRLLPIL